MATAARMVFPGNLTANTYCGMCTECLKTCTLDNVALYIRDGRPATAAEACGGTPAVDSAFKGLIMLACALIYSAVLIGRAF